MMQCTLSPLAVGCGWTRTNAHDTHDEGAHARTHQSRPVSRAWGSSHPIERAIAIMDHVTMISTLSSWPGTTSTMHPSVSVGTLASYEYHYRSSCVRKVDETIERSRARAGWTTMDSGGLHCPGRPIDRVGFCFALPLQRVGGAAIDDPGMHA